MVAPVRAVDLGFSVDDATLEKAFNAFKTLSDKKKDVYDEDIEALLDQELENHRKLWELVSMQVNSGTNLIATATVVLRDSAGIERMDAATGDGPIDAVYSALQRITGVTVTLEDYSSRAVTSGKDAQGEVTVELRHRDRKVRGRGLSTDVIEAAARAYLSAINRIKTTQDKEVAAATAAATASSPRTGARMRSRNSGGGKSAGASCARAAAD